jgi:hypothetical protein
MSKRPGTNFEGYVFFFERSTEGERIPHLIHLRVTNISNRKMNVEHTK